MPIEIEWKMSGVQEIAKALPALERAIRTGSVRSVGRPLSAAALRIVKELTPRQVNTNRAKSTKRGFEPFKSQWDRQEQIIQDTVYKARIYNKAAKDGPTSAGFRALAAVEFGARPHDIRSTKSHGLLVWDQPGSFRYFLRRQSDSPGALIRSGRDEIVDRFDRQSQAAGVVRTRLARHPGMQSFRMVQETRTILQRISGTMLHRFKTQIEQQFGRMTARVRTP